MHWVGDEMSNELTSLMKVNRAHNWKEFTEALRTFTSISQNIAYADTRGNIGIFCAAGIPIRNRDIVMGVLPGDTDKYNWKGYVPFEELPRIYNPASGFVASANNRTIPADYPYHIGTGIHCQVVMKELPKCCPLRTNYLWGISGKFNWINGQNLLKNTSRLC